MPSANSLEKDVGVEPQYLWITVGMTLSCDDSVEMNVPFYSNFWVNMVTLIKKNDLWMQIFGFFSPTHTICVPCADLLLDHLQM